MQLGIIKRKGVQFEEKKEEREYSGQWWWGKGAQLRVLKRKESEARKRSLVKNNLKDREKNIEEMWNSKEENGGEKDSWGTCEGRIRLSGDQREIWQLSPEWDWLNWGGGGVSTLLLGRACTFREGGVAFRKEKKLHLCTYLEC
jgi:hypothetical protein